MSIYRACLSWSAGLALVETGLLCHGTGNANTRGFAPPGGHDFKLQTLPWREACKPAACVPRSTGSEARIVSNGFRRSHTVGESSAGPLHGARQQQASEVAITGTIINGIGRNTSFLDDSLESRLGMAGEGSFVRSVFGSGPELSLPRGNSPQLCSFLMSLCEATEKKPL